MDQMSDSELLDIILPLVNFACELGSVVTRFDFLWTKQVMLSNLQDSFHNLFIFSTMIKYDWLSLSLTSDSMFELTPTWPNLTFGQLEPDFYFSSHSGPEYFFSITSKVGSNFIVTNRLQNYCIEVVCLSVCLCPSAMSLKWHANFKYIGIQLDMSQLGANNDHIWLPMG